MSKRKELFHKKRRKWLAPMGQYGYDPFILWNLYLCIYEGEKKPSASTTFKFYDGSTAISLDFNPYRDNLYQKRVNKAYRKKINYIIDMLKEVREILVEFSNQKPNLTGKERRFYRKKRIWLNDKAICEDANGYMCYKISRYVSKISNSRGVVVWADYKFTIKLADCTRVASLTLNEETPEKAIKDLDVFLNEVNLFRDAYFKLLDKELVYG